jgi:hypothetical protein
MNCGAASRPLAAPTWLCSAAEERGKKGIIENAQIGGLETEKKDMRAMDGFDEYLVTCKTCFSLEKKSTVGIDRFREAFVFAPGGREAPPPG